MEEGLRPLLITNQSRADDGRDAIFLDFSKLIEIHFLIEYLLYILSRRIYIYVYTYRLHDSILITSRSGRNVFENNCFQLYKNCIEISLRLFRLFSPN